jgi:ADP-heptose:LPS heptosyltransferase
MTRLVLRRGGLGDTLLMLPVLRALRAESPGAALHVAGVREFADVLVAFGAADRAVSSEDLALWSPHALRERLRGYARIVADDPAVAAAAPEGARVQVFDVRVRGTEPFGLQLAQRLGLAVHWPEDAWLVPPAPRAVTAPVVLAPGSGALGKCWPRERWLELAIALAAAGRKLAVVVGPAEAERDDPRRWPWPDGTTFLAGLTPIDLARALQRAGSFVGNDSGPTHLAAMLAVPTVALFGASDPRVWAPAGDHVHVLGAFGRAIDGIVVGEVAAKVLGCSQ